MTDLFTRAWRKLNKTVSSFLFLDQWVILVGRNVDYESPSWQDFRPLLPASDRYWADPFVLARSENYYVFIEEKIYQTGRGRIACLTLDKDGNLLSNQTVLERPYHLSYPFIFEYNGKMYMLPETAQNRTLELYRCTRFPDQWEFAKTLMSDIYMVDATLLERNGKWWLFANIKTEGGTSHDKLYLFSANHPLAEVWEPHPRNPIIADIHGARPAGRIFEVDGELIRPSQDCSRRYGYALNFNRITMLDGLNYDEVRHSVFQPPDGGKVLAIHTWNADGGMTVSDAVIRRRKQARTPTSPDVGLSTSGDVDSRAINA
ncbi:MAG: hypothetical protein AB1649_10875 [Chloroflexota bacterium]